jgi:hypothetical protein
MYFNDPTKDLMNDGKNRKTGIFPSLITDAVYLPCRLPIYSDNGGPLLQNLKSGKFFGHIAVLRHAFENEDNFIRGSSEQ